MRIIDLSTIIDSLEERAKAEKVSILSLIYFDHILPLVKDGISANQINATEELIGEIFKKDERITEGKSWGLYMSKAPSTYKEISKKLKKYEIAIEGV